METVSSIVKKEGEHQFLSFSIDGEELKIPLTDDNPQAVKEVFNKLIVRLKKGIFKIEMTEAGKDLFSQVADEYVKQLNKDLSAVHGDLAHYNLIIKPTEEQIWDKPN